MSFEFRPRPASVLASMLAAGLVLTGSPYPAIYSERAGYTST